MNKKLHEIKYTEELYLKKRHINNYISFAISNFKIEYKSNLEGINDLLLLLRSAKRRYNETSYMINKQLVNPLLLSGIDTQIEIHRAALNAYAKRQKELKTVIKMLQRMNNVGFFGSRLERIIGNE